MLLYFQCARGLCSVCSNGSCCIFSELQNFDIHGYGQEVLNTSQFADEVEDHLHFFLEECDHLQVCTFLLTLSMLRLLLSI